MKILVAIACYGTANDKYLARLIEEYRSMRDHVDVVVVSNIPRPGLAGVEVRVGLPTRDPWSLPFAHKAVLSERVNDYDLFIYSEDDTLITERNIRAFLDVTPLLKANEIAGFFQVERGEDGAMNYPAVHAHFHWEPASVQCRGGRVFAHFTCEHTGCYILTQRQLKSAIDSGGYSVAPHRGKYDLACTASTDPYTQCGFQKRVCISHIDDFLVQHLPNKYFGTRFGVDDPEFRRQLQVLMRISQNGRRPVELFSPETALQDCVYSKDYYEPVRNDVISNIPGSAASVLSVGCGAGNTEASLVAKGVRVVAVPIDPVISGAANAKGIEIVEGDFETARQRIKDERFDCLLLMNVLHLMEDPEAFLRSYGRLLSRNAVVLTLVPNLSSLASTWRGIRAGEMFKRRNGFRGSGVQFTHPRRLRHWFRNSGMSIDNLKTVGRSGSEFIVVARKAEA